MHSQSKIPPFSISSVTLSYISAARNRTAIDEGNVTYKKKKKKNSFKNWLPVLRLSVSVLLPSHFWCWAEIVVAFMALCDHTIHRYFWFLYRWQLIFLWDSWSQLSGCVVADTWDITLVFLCPTLGLSCALGPRLSKAFSLFLKSQDHPEVNMSPVNKLWKTHLFWDLLYFVSGATSTSWWSMLQFINHDTCSSYFKLCKTVF